MITVLNILFMAMLKREKASELGRFHLIFKRSK